MKKNLIVVFLLILLSDNCYAIVKPTSKFYVNDYANVLTDEVESYIYNNSVKLYNETSSQIVVVTVKNLEGKDLESYATELFRNFGIGDREKNNGLLLLLALDERKSRIEVGYGLEGILTDGKTGRIQDEYMIPYYKENNFSEGMLNGYKALFEIVANEYGYTGKVTKATKVSEEIEIHNSIATLIGCKLILTLILIAIGFKNRKIRFIVFCILEIATIILGYLTFKIDPALAITFAFLGTIFNLAVNVDNQSSFSSGGRHYSSGHSYHSSGSSHHGGGSSGGGGSSRSF